MTVATFVVVLYAVTVFDGVCWFLRQVVAGSARLAHAGGADGAGRVGGQVVGAPDTWRRAVQLELCLAAAERAAAPYLCPSSSAGAARG